MPAVARFPVRRHDPAGTRQAVAEVAVEEPLEVRVDGMPPFLTMRTPGHDTDLALGWLVGQGRVRAPADVRRVRERRSGDASAVEVRLADGVVPPAPRAYPATSACGVCGADLTDALRATWPASARTARIDPDVLRGMPDALRTGQPGFDRTGGSHAAGLFACADGATRVVREDVGRHNAVDKVVGWALRQGALPAGDCVLVVSGRASFELVAKAAAAGVAALAAVSAPSSLAVQLAREADLTLAAFVRDGAFTVYAAGHRLAPG